MSLIDELIAYGAKVRVLDCKPRAVQLEIDGLMYTSTKFPATIGLEIMPRVTGLIGAGLARSLATGDADAFTIDALLPLADRAMRDGLVPLAKDLISRLQCNKLRGIPDSPGEVLPDFDEHFAGEYVHLLKVAIFALAHNLRGPTYGAR